LSRSRKPIAGICFLLSLALYLATLCPTIYVGDSGDLITAGYLLGVPHPTGYPLYCLLGRVFAVLLPFGTVALRFNLLSALFSAAAVAVMFLVMCRLTGSRIISALSALALGTSSIWWSQSLSAEVYTLGGILLSLVLLSLALYETEGEGRYFLVGLFVLGLALTNHVTAALFLPAVLLFTLLRRRRPSPAAVLGGTALLLLPLLLYFYVILRARQSPPYFWAGTETWRGFLEHLQAVRYQWYLAPVSAGVLAHRLGSLVEAIQGSLNPILLSLAALGIVGFALRNPMALVMLLLPVALILAYASRYRIYDIETHLLPVLLCLAPLWAEGGAFLSSLPARLGSTGKRTKAVFSVGAGALLVVSIGLSLQKNLPVWDLSERYIAADYAKSLIRSASKGGEEAGLLILSGDTEVFGAAYFRLVEGFAPRLRLADYNGAVLEDVYGINKERYKASQRAYRQKVEFKLVRESAVPVFFSWTLPVEIPGVKLIEEGLVTRAIPDTSPAPPLDSPWRFTGIRALANPSAIKDPPSKKVLSSYYFRRADWWTQQGDTLSAVACLDSARSLGWNDPEILQPLSIVYGKLHRADLALLTQGRAAELAPFRGSQLKMLADLKFEQKDFPAAIELYRKAQELEGSLPLHTNIRLGEYYSSIGDYTSATSYYKAALLQNPEDPIGHATLASVYLRSRRWQEAAYECGLAISLDPNLAEVYGTLGLVLLNTKNFEEAARNFKKAIELKPESPESYFNLALAQAALDQPEEAEASLRKCLEVKPDFKDARLTLARLMFARKDFRHAVTELKEELKLDPKNVKALGDLGYAYANLESFDAAIAVWEKVLEIDASQSRAHFNLGLAYMNKHDPAKARAHLQEFLKQVPAGPQAELAREKLKEIASSGH